MLVDRRGLLASVFAGLAAGPVLAAYPDDLRICLLGQSLIEHDLRGIKWKPDDLRELIARNHVGFTDLETAVKGNRIGRPTRDTNVLHVAEPAVIDCLKSLGVTMATTANNHAYDLGTDGILDAIDALDARGIVHAGTGRTLAEATQAAVQATTHGRVALVAMASGAIKAGAAATATRAGVNELRRDGAGLLRDDVERTLAAIRTARAGAELVIACHHNHYWETPASVTPGWQRDLARACIEAGAGVFVAHGPPLLHGMEMHHGAPAFYDLGSFIFQTRKADDFYPVTAWESLAVECRFRSGKFVDALLTPIVLAPRGVSGLPDDFATRGRPRRARGAEASAILNRIDGLNLTFGTKLRRQGEQALWAAG